MKWTARLREGGKLRQSSRVYRQTDSRVDKHAPHGPLPCIIRSLPNAHTANFFGKFFHTKNHMKDGNLPESWLEHRTRSTELVLSMGAYSILIHEQSKSRILMLANSVTKSIHWQFSNYKQLNQAKSVTVSTVDANIIPKHTQKKVNAYFSIHCCLLFIYLHLFIILFTCENEKYTTVKKKSGKQSSKIGTHQSVGTRQFFKSSKRLSITLKWYYNTYDKPDLL